MDGGTEFKNNYSKVTLYKNQPLSTLCQHKMYELNDHTQLYGEISFPNPGCIKTDGKFIWHIHTTMYSDDTSGNVSKQWNKHIFFFTLSGLPSNLTNQEYNCHISYQHLTTQSDNDISFLKNRSSEMTLDGFEAYDITIGNLFLHATHVGYVLYTLPKKLTKQPRILQTWKTTIENTYELYNLISNQNITSVKNTWKIFGITDSLNNKVIECKRKKSPSCVADAGGDTPFFLLKGWLFLLSVFGSFDGCKGTPVEILHVFLLGVVKYLVRDFITTIKKPKEKKKLAELIGHFQSFNTNSLNILLKPRPDQPLTISALWHSLAHLSSYVFQTHITCMPTYQSELKKNIQLFMSHSIKFTAQWINKPKFHILLHLPLSILRFGASLFCPEKFDTGKRYCSHIFKLSILALSIIWRTIKQNKKQLQNAHCRCWPSSTIIQPSKSPLVIIQNFPVRSKNIHLKRHSLQVYQNFLFQNPCPEVKRSYFVWIKVKSASESTEYIGVVRCIWIAGGCFFVHVSKMKRIHFQDIKSTLNLQHDCHRGKCEVINTRSTRIERLNTTIKTPEVQHRDESFFILNSASLHAREDHHRLADLPANIVFPNELVEIAHPGLSRWGVIEAPAANTADIQC
ncbi:hypothetical protein VP01_432g11 [Puccinia sorghi]|uniref:Uncharacterized protein n=1 Tax=Puccinia sorghi TaxID=27349 RepID=A0A0L6UQ00_9BASI|nr:hypothetical protein VP01_432g11 [Puccinia sorghi]